MRGTLGRQSLQRGYGNSKEDIGVKQKLDWCSKPDVIDGAGQQRSKVKVMYW